MVSEAVSITVAALPVPTQYATQTPYATAVAYATPSPYPTPEAYDTATPYPTFTPYPTYTPTPTEIPATDTPIAALPTIAAPLATAVTTSVLTTQEMLRLIDITRGHVGDFIGIIDNALLNRVDVDCQVVVEKYNTLVNLPTVVVPEGDAPLRNAHNAWRGAVDYIIERNNLIQDCASKIAAEGSGSIPASNWGPFRNYLSQADTALGNVRRELLALSG